MLLLLPSLLSSFLYYYICCHLYAWYLQLCTRNKPCFCGIQCCSCSVFTICATCNAISHVQYVLYFCISTFQNACAVPNTVVCSSFFRTFPVCYSRTVRMILKCFQLPPLLLVLLLLLLYNMYVSCHIHFFLVLLLNQR